MFKNHIHVLLILTMATFIFNSCQNEQNPVEPNRTFNQQTKFSKVSIPYGATIDSAKFYINVTTPQNQEVTVHRITKYWEEMFVNWYNFIYGFDSTTVNSFIPTSAGWCSTDITSLVTGWYDETILNRGLLLKEFSPNPFQYYTSKEGGNGPHLKVWWTLNGSQGYDSTTAFADSYIRSDSVFVNYGGSTELISGWQDTIEVQTLVKFEIELIYTGCTRSQGYWKTHSEYGPAPYDSTWAVIDEDSIFFLSNKTNYEVMWTPPSGGNAYYILAHQYIATYLNFLSGADPADAYDAFEDATELFETYTPEYIGSLKGNNSIRQEFIMLGGILDEYNSGIIGPGKCEEIGGVIPNRHK